MWLEGPHCLLGTAFPPWCLEPGAWLLNHWRGQACPAPPMSPGMVFRQCSVASDANAESARTVHTREGSAGHFLTNALIEWRNQGDRAARGCRCSWAEITFTPQRTGPLPRVRTVHISCREEGRVLG